jgi:hypothetical protein
MSDVALCMRGFRLRCAYQDSGVLRRVYARYFVSGSITPPTFLSVAGQMSVFLLKERRPHKIHIFLASRRWFCNCVVSEVAIVQPSCLCQSSVARLSMEISLASQATVVLPPASLAACFFRQLLISSVAVIGPLYALMLAGVMWMT